MHLRKQHFWVRPDVSCATLEEAKQDARAEPPVWIVRSYQLQEGGKPQEFVTFQAADDPERYLACADDDTNQVARMDPAATMEAPPAKVLWQITQVRRSA